MNSNGKVLQGQSALEYLTTYGWAIIIIGVVISALVFLGVFNPSSLVSQQCIFPAGFVCNIGSMTSNGILTFALTQATGSPI
ncbi:MAG: hypothetical protein QXL16_01695, partial [Candidatus Micrarchaeaceae archaeon]